MSIAGCRHGPGDPANCAMCHLEAEVDRLRDSEFGQRLKRLVDQHRTILDRLAEDDG